MIWAVVPPLQPFCSAQMETGLLQAPCAKNSQKGLSVFDQLAAWEGLVGNEVAHLKVKVTLHAASP